MTTDKITIYPVLLSRRGDDGFLADGSALPMGCLVAYFKVHANGKLNDYFELDDFVQRYEPDWSYYTDKAVSEPPGVWLFSCYAWNFDDNMRIAKQVKETSPDSLILVGGPHIPTFHGEAEQFFADYPYVDIAARAEGEITLGEILETIANNNADGGNKNLHVDFSAIEGITFRENGGLHRTADRTRTRDLDQFPSPFLTGLYEHTCFEDAPAVVLETNRGCPYGCTYCDWGAATLSKISHFDFDRVMEEIDLIGQKRARAIHIADANFGAFERDIAIARKAVETYQKYGFPKEFNCNYAKNASPKVAEIIKILNEGGLLTSGIIAIQTTDKDTLEAVKRDNIKNKKYEQLIDIFKEENLYLSSELLIGLPGQTYESHREDLQFFFDRKLVTSAYDVQVMPNAPMNEPSYKAQYAIKTDEDGYVIASSTFTEEEHHEMHELFLAFQFFYMCGVLKYYLYFIQVEHGVRAMEFVDKLLQTALANAELYPYNHKIKTFLLKKVDKKFKGILKLQWRTEDSEFLFNHLDEYYAEVFKFAQNEYGIKPTDTETATLLGVQTGVMPTLGKEVPQEYNLPHDFVNYFEQIKEIRSLDKMPSEFNKLSSYGHGKLRVRALKPKTIDNLTLLIKNVKIGAGWELRSPLQFVKARNRKKQQAA